jgi:uncharacterized protein YPO0396
MKLLKKLLLINWHYFSHELIEFEKINFLTGKNASGKSTIIDAMQVLLLADTSGNSFNKAASGRSNRTLRGYLLGELGDDEDAGFKHLRNGRFTSLLAMEFFDDEKKSFFTAGCCFDIYSENDIQRMFFRFNGAMPEHQFIIGKKPMEITALRSYVREQFNQSNYFTSDTNQRFREDLYGKLGGLQSRFSGLLKKAVSFDPNVDIQKFISEFVCDTQQPVDISSLQENIRSYARLELEEKMLEERIKELTGINAIYDTFNNHRESALVYGYLIDRAHIDIKYAAIVNQEKNKQDAEQNIKELKTTIEYEESRQKKTQTEREELHLQLMNNETAQIVEHLELQIQEKRQEVNTIKDNFEKIAAHFSVLIQVWIQRIPALCDNPARLLNDMAHQSLITMVENISESAKQCINHIKKIDATDPLSISKLGKDALQATVAAVDELRSSSFRISSRLEDEAEDVMQKQKALQAEETLLEKGIYQFPQSALDLKEAIAGKLRVKTGKAAEVFIVAEVAEIHEPRWRNVIEGYLNTQKFYLIVAPEHFVIALNVYDAIKRDRHIYDTGLVDIEKIEKLQPRAEPGSLAEEIATDNSYVRLFLDYTLGHVMKCDKVNELRRHRTAITDNGMLYQNYVARAINPKRWERPAIGQMAIQARLQQVKKDLRFAEETLSAFNKVIEIIKGVSGIAIPGKSEAEQFLSAASICQHIPQLEQDIADIKVHLESVDRSAIETLRERVAALDATLVDLKRRLDDYKYKSGVEEEKLRNIIEDTLPKLKNDLAEMEEQKNANYIAEWIESAGHPRYEKELSTRGNPAAIEQAFPREKSRCEKAKEALWDELKDMRRRYNDKYKMGYDTAVDTNDVYKNVLLELNENKLPDYRAKIEDARSKAHEQFREDFLSRLQSNFNDAKRQIDSLNKALDNSSFGDDAYRFRIIPKQEHKRYYDMIIDPMLLDGGYNLASEHFNTKYKEEINELFSLITNTGDGKQLKDTVDYEKRVQTFTDYRTYLAFDLEVTNKEGESQRLSRTLGKKSGGETQTPFYIAVLASFAQLYRIGRNKKSNTVRIIIFDEAFSKMDSERIISSIVLLRRFDFQVILSAPPDKIADIAVLVDRNLCVLRQGKDASVRVFDPRGGDQLTMND